MWNCIFNKTTGIGSGFNRNPGENEMLRQLPKEDCGWFYLYPNRYKFVSGKLSERKEWADEVADEELAKEQVIIKEQALAAEIETAKEAAGLQKVATLAEVQAWIGKEFDKAESISDVKEAVQNILLKILPYIMSVEYKSLKALVDSKSHTK